MDSRERAARLELVEFQLGELTKAELKAGEDEELATLRQVLRNAETIERLCSTSYAELYESEESVLAGLGHVWKRVGELAAIEPSFAGHLDQRDAIKAQLEDLAFALRDYADEHRRVAWPARTGRGAARPARAPEAQARPDAGRRAPTARRTCGRAARVEWGRGGRRRDRSRARDRRRELPDDGAPTLGARRRTAALKFATAIERRAGRSGHGADPLRGPARAP